VLILQILLLLELVGVPLLDSPVILLLLNSYAVVLVFPNNLFQVLLHQPLDHGIPASQVSIAILVPVRLQERLKDNNF